MSQVLIRQVMNEDIRFSSYKMWKGQFLSKTVKGKSQTVRPQTLHGCLRYVPDRASVILNQEGVRWKALCIATGVCTKPHKQVNPVMATNVCDHMSPKISPPNYPSYNPLDYHVCGAVERETTKTHCNKDNELKKKHCGSIFQLKQEDQPEESQKIPKPL